MFRKTVFLLHYSLILSRRLQVFQFCYLILCISINIVILTLLKHGLCIKQITLSARKLFIQERKEV